MTSEQTNIEPGTGKNETLRLLNAQVFFRHGARTPLRHFDGVEEVTYDKNVHDAPLPHAELPYEVIDLDTGERVQCLSPEEKSSNRLFKGGMYCGMLTTTGKQQMYNLGQRLKRRYVDELKLVGEQFNRDEVFVRSSNINRTIESLQCVVAGMFGVEQFRENGALIISTRNCQVEDLMPNTRNCRTLRQIVENINEGLLKNPQYKDVLTKVKHITGITYDLDMVIVFDHMTSRKAHGLHVEQWMLDLENEIAKAAVAGVHYYIAGDKNHWAVAKPLGIGKLYHTIEDNMKAAIKGDNSTQKLHLYSCHDTSIIPLMLILGDPVDHWPPYAADFRFELYEDGRGKHWVKLIFCGEEYTPSGCEDSLIEFAKFQDIIKRVKLTPEQYTHMCSDLDTAKEFIKMNY